FLLVLYIFVYIVVNILFFLFFYFFFFFFFFFFSSRRRHTRCLSDWSSDVCSSDLIGFTLVIATIWSAVRNARNRFGLEPGLRSWVFGLGQKPKAKDQRPISERNSRRFIVHGMVSGTLFSIAFALALAPWTVRNWRVFHLFQPLAPMNAEMPGEFIPHGYLRWVKTWLDDQRYIDVAVWEVGIQPITIDDLPNSAFDSLDERTRVAALLEQYNHPPQEQASDDEEQ